MKFEGDYLNGVKIRGKEFNRDQELIFEGEYINEQRWKGKGKEYNGFELIFEGEYLYGYKLRGKEYINGKLE